MASLTGQLVAETYKALLKTIDNDILTASEKQITDGLGGGSNVFIDSQGFLRAYKYKVTNGLATQFLKADGSLDANTYLTSITGAQVITALGYTPVTNARTLTINGTTYDLTANRSWTVAGTAAVWGNITGTLSNQTDLQTALNAKFNNPTGTISQYIRGDGSLATFPTLPGGLPTGGTAGQILAKIDATDYNAHWIDNFATQTKNEVKLGATLAKGTAVYVSGSTGGSGTNMIVMAASNASEALSSKTFGLLETGGATNDFVKCVTFGLIAGLDTSTATAGDPVWLGVNGALLFGLANKPIAPANMVYIGVVTRVQSNNGEIFVNVQNGFEIEELHDVLIQSKANNQGLFYESSTGLWKNKSIATVLGYTPQAQLNGTGLVRMDGTTVSYDNNPYPSGSGSVGYIPVWNTTTGLSNSSLFQSSGSIGLNITNVNYSAYGRAFTGASFAASSFGYEIASGATADGGLLGGLAYVLTENDASRRIGAKIESNVVGTTATNLGANLRFYVKADNAAIAEIARMTASGVTFYSGITATSFVKTGGTSNEYLRADGSVNVITGDIISGSGTAGYIAKFGSSAVIASSNLFESAANIGFGTITLNYGSYGRAFTGAGFGSTAFGFEAVTGSTTNGGLIGGLSLVIASNDSTRRIGSAIQSYISGATSTHQGADLRFFVKPDNGILLEVVRMTSAGITFNKDLTAANINATTFVKSGGTASEFLMADGSVSTYTNPVTGTGSAGYIPKWTSASNLGSSFMYDDGTSIGIAYTTPNRGGYGRALSGASFGSASFGFEAVSNTTTNGGLIGGLSFIVNQNDSSRIVGSAIQSYLSGTTATNYGATLRFYAKPDGGSLAEVMAMTSAGLRVYGTIIKDGGTSSQYLMADGSVSTLTGVVTGSGTANRLTKFTGASSVGNSLLYDNGANIGINGFASNWGAGTEGVIQTKNASVYGYDNYEAGLVANAYFNTDWYRIAANTASMIILNTNITFRLAATGTAGSAITWTNALNLSNNGSAQFLNTVSSRGSSTSASLTLPTFLGAGEFMSTGSTGGYFWENRSGGVTSNSNWYGWYTSTGVIRLFNGATDILHINGSNGNTRTFGNLGIGRDPSTVLDVYAGNAGNALTYMQNTASTGYSGIDFFRSNGNHAGSVWVANDSAGATNNRNALTIAARWAGEKVIIVGGGYDPTVTGGFEVQGSNTQLQGLNAFHRIKATSGNYAYLHLNNTTGGTARDAYFIQNTFNDPANGAAAGSAYLFFGQSQQMEFLWSNVSQIQFTSTGSATFAGGVQATRFSIGGTPFPNVGYTFKGTISGNNDTWGTFQGTLTHAPSANNALAVGYHSGGNVNRGTFTGLSYRGFQQDNIVVSGTGTLATAYGVYIDEITSATNNYSAYFAQRVGIGINTPATNLHIQAASQSYGQLRITSTSNSAGEASINYGRTDQAIDNRWTVGQGLNGIGDSFGFYSGGSVRFQIATNGVSVFSSNVTASGFEIPNGQFYRARRSSSNLLTDMIGIPSGTDDVRILTTGDFNIINGSLSNLITIRNGGSVGIGTTNTTGLSPQTLYLRSNPTNVGQTAISLQDFLGRNRWAINGQDVTNDFSFAIYSAPNAVNDFTRRLRITQGGTFTFNGTDETYRYNFMSGSVYIPGGQSGASTAAYTSWDQLVFADQFSDVARGPNKIVTYGRGGGWVGGIGIHNDTQAYYAGGTHKFYKFDGTTATLTMSIDGSGNISGTAFFELSDMRLKKLIDGLPQIAGIENLQAKLYEKNGKIELGYFAQDAEKLMPYAVTKNEDGFLNLSYREVHTAKIARLEKRVAELEKQLNLN